MKKNDTSAETTPAAESPAEPLLSITVLVTGTVIGDLKCGAGLVLRIPRSQAETLAKLDPPRVRIDGV